MAEQDEMDPELRRRLEEAWPAQEPRAGFAERVVAARQAEVAAPLRPGRRMPLADRPRLRHAILAGLIAASVVGAFFFIVRAPSSIGSLGSLRADARQELRLGGRGVAVLEPGSRLDWKVKSDGEAQIRQWSGDVFYRVEPGREFRVWTPTGEVTVKGTCFRVELTMTPNKKMLVSGAVSAALAATLVVSVYEGKVLVKNSRGEVTIQAGEQAKVEPAAKGAPQVVEIKRASQAEETPEPPAADVTREQLLERDKQQRAEIAALSAQVRALEQAGKPVETVDMKGGGHGVGRPEREKMFDLTPSEWAEMAKRCEVRYGLPLLGDRAGASIPKGADLNDAERQRVEQVLKQISDHYMKTLRALYVEATGDAEGADHMEAQAMSIEILQKSADDDEARRRVALERAGQAQPPADPSTGSAAERYYRMVLNVGDELGAELAKIVGPDRASSLRERLSGMRSVVNGCRGQEDEEAAGGPK